MNLQQARGLLNGGGAGKLGDMVQALIVVLAHARQEHDRGDLRRAKELGKDAERGLQILDRILKGWFSAGGWSFIRNGYESAEDVASVIVTRIWVTYMKGKNPSPPEVVEQQHPAQLVKWVTTIARNLAIDKNKFYCPKSDPKVPVLPPLPGPVQGALSAELQVERNRILTRTVQELKSFAEERPTVLGGRIKMSDFLGELVNFRMGEKGLVEAIRERIGGPHPPSAAAVRQAVHEAREQLAARLVWLPGEWEDWCAHARAEGLHIGEEAADADGGSDPGAGRDGGHRQDGQADEGSPGPGSSDSADSGSGSGSGNDEDSSEGQS